MFFWILFFFASNAQNDGYMHIWICTVLYSIARSCLDCVCSTTELLKSNCLLPFLNTKTMFESVMQLMIITAMHCFGIHAIPRPASTSFTHCIHHVINVVFGWRKKGTSLIHSNNKLKTCSRLHQSIYIHVCVRCLLIYWLELYNFLGCKDAICKLNQWNRRTDAKVCVSKV